MRKKKNWGGAKGNVQFVSTDRTGNRRGKEKGEGPKSILKLPGREKER